MPTFSTDNIAWICFSYLSLSDNFAQICYDCAICSPQFTNYTDLSAQCMNIMLQSSI